MDERNPFLSEAWIFQADPKVYNLEGALKALDTITWTMRQHRDRVGIGDRVYLLVTGPDAGIIGVATVRSEPEIGPEDDVERRYWLDPAAADEPQPRVRLAIERVVEPRLPRDVLRQDPVLSTLPNLRMPQGTNYPLSEEHATALEARLESWLATAGRSEQQAGTGGLPRVVKIAPGHEGRYWKDCLAGGYICVGWGEVGDLRQYPAFAAFRNAFRDHYSYNGHEPTVTRKARETWTLRELRPGDVVIANQGTEKVLGVGRVVEPGYEYRADLDYPHIVHVSWDRSKERTIPMVRAWFAWTVADVPPAQLAAILPDVANELGIIPVPDQPPVAPQVQTDRSAWVVLQSGDATYRDIEGRAYHYPLGIPNGRQIGAGDLIVVARTARATVGEGRLIGVGEVDRIEEEGGEATAWYGWYATLAPPASFEEVGGDPRSNRTNSINRVPLEWVERVLASRGLTLDGMTPVEPTDGAPPTAGRSRDPLPERDRTLTLEWLQNETLWPREELERIVATLTGPSPQVVLAGPPGTGKTWVAQRIARFLTGGVPGAVRLVQFHPSYGYEQFIEGLRPVVEDGGGIAFRRVDGVILEIVAGMHRPDDRRVLVIDEMNRANLPRVFGELMYLFEYRQEPIALQYSPSFALPPGLLFIGTMNTADRSIRSLDIALRRRFDVFECPPSGAILRRWYELPEHLSEVPDLVSGFEQLNVDLASALDRHHTIGHTFFMAERMTPERLAHVWRHKLTPLIEEYFFDQPDVAAQFELRRYWPDADVDAD